MARPLPHLACALITEGDPMQRPHEGSRGKARHSTGCTSESVPTVPFQLGSSVLMATELRLPEGCRQPCGSNAGGLPLRTRPVQSLRCQQRGTHPHGGKGGARRLPPGHHMGCHLPRRWVWHSMGGPGRGQGEGLTDRGTCHSGVACKAPSSGTGQHSSSRGRPMVRHTLWCRTGGAGANWQCPRRGLCTGRACAMGWKWSKRSASGALM